MNTNAYFYLLGGIAVFAVSTASAADRLDAPGKTVGEFTKVYHDPAKTEADKANAVADLFVYSQNSPKFRGPYTNGVLTKKAEIATAWENFFTRNPTAQLTFGLGVPWPAECVSPTGMSTKATHSGDAKMVALGSADNKSDITHKFRIGFDFVQGYGCKISYLCLWSQAEKPEDVCP